VFVNRCGVAQKSECRSVRHSLIDQRPWLRSRFEVEDRCHARDGDLQVIDVADEVVSGADSEAGHQAQAA
jgi:hypothetical protein